MTTEREFSAWAAKLRETHPEMVARGADRNTKRKTARNKWDPLLLRVYGIEPWQMGKYTLAEYAALIDDLERNGLGSGL